MISKLNQRFICFEAARGHGKTELISVAYPIWLMYKARKPIEILFVSGTDKQCKNVVRRIRNHIEENELLRSILFPSALHETNWSATQLKTKNKCFFQAMPITSKSILGNHVHYLVLDDIYGDKTLEIESVNDSFDYNARPTINVKKGQMVFIGTPKSYKDKFAEIREKHNEIGFIYGRYPAIISDSEGNPVPLWPKQDSIGFTIEELNQIKSSMSIIAWEREYMLNVVSEGYRLFPEALVTQLIVDGIDTKPVTEFASYYMGVDVALSDSNRADYSVFTVLEKIPNAPWEIVKIERMKGWSSDKQIERIEALHKAYNFKRILIEQIGLSEGLVEHAKNSDVIRTAAEGFKTNTQTREGLLSKLEILMRNKGIHIPRNPVLIDELLMWGIREEKGRQRAEGLGSHDDCVISLALSVEAASRHGIVSATLIE